MLFSIMLEIFYSLSTQFQAMKELIIFFLEPQEGSQRSKTNLIIDLAVARYIVVLAVLGDGF